MRKFKLLKDLPYVKAGMLYEWSSFEERYISGEIPVMKNDYLQKEIVENNPEWFSEIVEPKPQEIIEDNLTNVYGKISSMHNGERDSILIINPTVRIVTGKQIGRAHV